MINHSGKSINVDNSKHFKQLCSRLLILAHDVLDYP